LVSGHVIARGDTGRHATGRRTQDIRRKAMKAAPVGRHGNDSMSRPLARITHGSIDVAGRQRSYTLAEPPGAAPGTSLVLLFHGSKQTGEKFRVFTGHSFDALASTGRTVVAYLDGYKSQWNDARAANGFAARTENVDDVAFAEAMVSKLQASHQIDSSKVYAAGFSNGGSMVIRLVHQVPGLLAGAAVIAATQPAPENFLLADALPVPLPVVLIHGTGDPIVAYEGGAMSWWVRRFFRVGGVSLSAPQTAAYFAARNAITQPFNATNLPHRRESGKTSVTRADYQQDGKLPVTLYTVHAGGHTIPGPRKAPFIMGRTTQDLNAAEAIGQFFGLMPLPEPSKTR
jgi:polyhydroxybutyrate depolymerase